MKNKENYLLLFIFFILGYLFGFCLIGIITYPLIMFNKKELEYAMKNGMICGFFVSLLLVILFY